MVPSKSQGVKDIERVIAEMRERGIRIDVFTTYAQLLEAQQRFASGAYPMVSVLSTTNLAKSHIFNRGEHTHLIKAGVSRVGLYQWCYEMQQRYGLRLANATMWSVLLDDATGMMKTKDDLEFLKALCDRNKTKVLSHIKQNAQLRKAGVPTSFAVKNSVCILANSFPGANADLDALCERGKIIVFLPSVYEVHNYVKAWPFPSEHADILEFIGQNLRFIGRPTIGWYTNAIWEKVAGEDWRHWLRVQWQQAEPLLSIIAALRDDGFTAEKMTKRSILAEWQRRLRCGSGLCRARAGTDCKSAEGNGCPFVAAYS